MYLNKNIISCKKNEAALLKFKTASLPALSVEGRWVTFKVGKPAVLWGRLGQTEVHSRRLRSAEVTV